MTAPTPGFEVCAVVHLVRPLGRTASDLASLRDLVAEAEAAALFLHTIQPPLRAPASDVLPPDDFSAWTAGVLQEPRAAERIAAAIARSAPGVESLRRSLLGVLGPLARRVDATAPGDGEFRLFAADSVPVTIATFTDPAELFDELGRADASVWFYHFVEQPWYGGGDTPLLRALRAAGEPRLAAYLRTLARSGLTLDALRTESMRWWRRSHLGTRIARAIRRPEFERSEAGRTAIRRLARWIVHGEDA